MNYIFDYIGIYLKRQSEEKALKIYITDALQLICENTANFSHGKYMSIKYSDIVYKADNKPQRSSEDIINSVKKNLKEMRGEKDERI